MVSFPPVSPPRPYTHPSPHRSILILSTHLRLGLPSGLFPSSFPTKTLYTPSPHRSILILSTHLRLGLPSGLFPSSLPTKTRYTTLSSPIRATCPAHLILLDFITRTILGEGVLLCTNILLSPVVSAVVPRRFSVHADRASRQTTTTSNPSCISLAHTSFLVFKVLRFRIMVFWVVTPCRLARRCQCFG